MTSQPSPVPTNHFTPQTMKITKGYIRLPYALPVVVITVSPSSPQAVVFAVLAKLNGRKLFPPTFSPMLRYRLLLTLWMVEPMVKYSLVDSGPITGIGEMEVLLEGRVCRYRWKMGDWTPRSCCVICESWFAQWKNWAGKRIIWNHMCCEAGRGEHGRKNGES